jgi:peptide subunit release factor 1 (eRF1)
MDIRERLGLLAKIAGAATPVVSVYLNTHWADEHQRERVRVFLKNAIRRARGKASSRELIEDLDWVEQEGALLVQQARFPEAQGVALFACHALGLREVLPVRVPFGDAFLVADRPFLTPLAEVAEGAPPALLVFVDGVSARLIPLNPDGRGEEVTLRHEVEGRHRRGGWALMAQSRYQRHIEAHRGRHFEAVAAALAQMVDERRIEHIVLAGETRALAVFAKHLPPPLAARVVGSVPAARYESASVLVERAAELLAALDRRQETVAVESTLIEAAKGGRAVAGLDETLDAVGRGAVHHLYLSKGFDRQGRACVACGALQNGEGSGCRACGAPTRETQLGEAIVDRVIAAGGAVEVVEAHPGLARVGGIAARLRYAM